MAAEICDNLSSDTRNHLMRCVDPTDEFLLHLSMDSRLQKDITAVETLKTVEAKNSRLLRILCRAPEQDRYCILKLFEEALSDTQQNHVADVLRGVTTTIMSQKHYDLLSANAYKLRKFISARNELVEILCGDGVFNKSDKNIIFSEETDADMASAIVEILQRKSDSCFDKFIEALNNSGQDHVAFILTGVGNKYPLKDEFVSHINKWRGTVVNNMESKTGSLVSQLLSASVLSDSDKQRVMSKATNVRRNELILDILLRKSQQAYDEFVKTLRKCDQEHVARLLEGHEFEGTVDLGFAEESKDGRVVGEVNRQLLENELRNQLIDELVDGQKLNTYSATDIDECGTAGGSLSQLLERNGILTQSIGVGSILIRFRCLSLESFINFCRMYDEGILSAKFSDEYCPQYANRGLTKIALSMSKDGLNRCGVEFRRDVETLMWSERQQTLQLISESAAVTDKIVVTDDLLDGLSMHKHTKEFIREMNDGRDKVRTFLDVVSRRPDAAYDQLITALKATGQQAAARLILRQSRSDSSQHIAGRKRRKRRKRRPDHETTSPLQLPPSDMVPAPVVLSSRRLSLNSSMRMMDTGENIDWEGRCEELQRRVTELVEERYQRTLADLRLALVGPTTRHMSDFVFSDDFSDGIIEFPDFDDLEVQDISVNAAAGTSGIRQFTMHRPCSIEARLSRTSSEIPSCSLSESPSLL